MRKIWIASLLFVLANSAFAESFATIETSLGTVRAKLLVDKAPLTVSNFVSLAKAGFYKNSQFHKILPGILVQGGGPTGDPNGGPGYCIKDEYDPTVLHDKGTLSMSSRIPDGAGSQFIISLRKAPHLDGRNNIFAVIVEGDEVVSKMTKAELKGATPKEPIKIRNIRIQGNPGQIPFEKIQELDKVKFKQVGEKTVIKLLEGISSPLGLGNIMKLSLESVRAQCAKTQVNYKVDFAKAKDSKLLIYGNSTPQGFELIQHQFQKGR